MQSDKWVDVSGERSASNFMVEAYWLLLSALGFLFEPKDGASTFL
jgi:hypothetical protein